MRGFKFYAFSTLFIFMGMLIFVTATALVRKSGNTGWDMAKVHLLRFKVR